MSEFVIFVVRSRVRETGSGEVPSDVSVEYNEIFARSICDWISGFKRQL